VTPAPITVYIVDDEPSIRQALSRLLHSVGMRGKVFETVSELVNTERFTDRACIVADIRLPEISGLELPALLARQGRRLPVIFVTAYDTDENRAAARLTGAAAFFRKPVDGQALLDAITWAVEAAGAEPEC
jgi:FixJ family two-component response regulator